MCSQSGQDIIKNAIAEHNLTGLVICSCSPRMHEATFRKTAQAAGLNPYMVEIANIREQCSWVHKEMPVGTEKAIILAKAAVAKSTSIAPLPPAKGPVTKRALVIGRRHRRNPDRSRYRGRGLPGGYRRNEADNRRQDGTA